MKNLNNLSDIELLELFKSGNVNAFTTIYRKYWMALVLHAKHMVKDPDLARDIVQDIFTAIYTKIKTIEIKTSLNAYLYGSVRFGVLREIKKGNVEGKYLDFLASYLDTNFSHTDDEFKAKELSYIIESEIAKMPPRMQDIFELSRKEYMSHKQIADSLHLSIHTVQTQITRALSRLKLKVNY